MLGLGDEEMRRELRGVSRREFCRECDSGVLGQF
jgi:hypothetical protein